MFNHLNSALLNCVLRGIGRTNWHVHFAVFLRLRDLEKHVKEIDSIMVAITLGMHGQEAPEGVVSATPFLKERVKHPHPHSARKQRFEDCIAFVTKVLPRYNACFHAIQKEVSAFIAHT